MNTIVTSRDAILKKSRELIRQKGCSALNIRAVANECGVAVGSIYNYFSSKAELNEAVVESVWSEIFPHGTTFQDTLSCVAWMFERVKYGSEKYPGFFTLHSLAFMQDEKPEGRRKMWEMWQHIENSLQKVILNDPNVRKDAFSDDFSVEKLTSVIFSLLLSAMLRADYDPSATLEIIKRTVY